jgi:hypothetical protein
MAITNEPLEPGTCNLLWRQIITIPTNSVKSYLQVKNYKYGGGAKLWAISDKFNVERICTLVTGKGKGVPML